MKRAPPIEFALAAVLAAWAGVARAEPPAAGLDCMIQPNQVVQLGTPSAGVIQSIRVDRGDFVRRGQALVHMKDDVERAALAVARERASQSGEADAARSAHELATREAQRAAELVEENFVSRTFFDKQRAEAQVAAGRGQQAEERRKLAAREAALASAQLAQRTVASPIDGVVVERYASAGEYVEQKPVLRIAAVNPLRVDVLVPAAAFGQVHIGDKATVVPELLNRATHTAAVTSVDRVIDAASNTFRVRLELANPGGALPPGLRCKVDLGLIGLGPASAAALAPPAPGRAALPPRTPAKAPEVPREAPATASLATPAATRVTLVTPTASAIPLPRVLRLKMAPIELPTASALLAARR